MTKPSYASPSVKTGKLTKCTKDQVLKCIRAGLWVMSWSISQQSVANIPYWPVPAESSLACGMCEFKEEVEFSEDT